MNVKFSAALLHNEWLSQVFKGLAQRCELSVRKTALPASKVLDKLTKQYQREMTHIMFLFAKVAPDDHPQKGKMVIEPVLMADENEYNEYLKKIDALNNKEHSVEWPGERPKVALPPSILKKMPQDELEAAELFFDIVEGAEEKPTEEKR